MTRQRGSDGDFVVRLEAQERKGSSEPASILVASSLELRDVLGGHAVSATKQLGNRSHAKPLCSLAIACAVSIRLRHRDGHPNAYKARLRCRGDRDGSGLRSATYRAILERRREMRVHGRGGCVAVATAI